jgi:2-polyprenyl-6-methoxyphenol hydroxylase-like FAD-dependent oxidoreductase
MDCPSRSHYVFNQHGKILGYYGNRFNTSTSTSTTVVERNSAKGARGFAQRGNLRVPRQCLRKIMMDTLIERDIVEDDENDENENKDDNRNGNGKDTEKQQGDRKRKGFVQIQWGKKLISYTQSASSNHNSTNNAISNGTTNSTTTGNNDSNNNQDDPAISLGFDDGSSDKADILIGADGVRSVVIKELLSPKSITTTPHMQKNNKTTPTPTPETATATPSPPTKTNKNTDLSYLGIMIVLGITKDFFHPLLDERGFYTLDGEHRLFTMPFEGCRITDLEQLNISFDDNIDSSSNSSSSPITSNMNSNNTTASGDDNKTTPKNPTTRRYMWQLSYKLSSLEEATSLSQNGSQALLDEVLKRTKKWHNPVQEMMKSTPMETIWGTPLMDRQPNLIHDKLMKELYNSSDFGRMPLRTIVLGDSIHAMSPFKGQGCNQALMDGPLLSSWFEKSTIDSAIKGFMREMVQRTNKKVTASREAAKFLHSEQVLSNEEDFAGVRKDSIQLLLQTLEKRNIGAHLGAKLDEKVSEIIKELDIYQEEVSMQEEIDCSEEQKIALKLAANSDTAAIRILSMSHPNAIRIAKDDKTQETCLHLAAKSGCYHTCKWLLSEASVDVNAIDSNGHSPLDAAKIGGNPQIVSLISKLTENSK